MRNLQFFYKHTNYNPQKVIAIINQEVERYIVQYIYYMSGNYETLFILVCIYIVNQQLANDVYSIPAIM